MKEMPDLEASPMTLHINAGVHQRPEQARLPVQQEPQNPVAKLDDITIVLSTPVSSLKCTQR